MHSVLSRWTLVGREVVDAEGASIGKVMGTHPADGGGEPTLVLVHLGHKFPRRRWLPVEGCRASDDARLHVRWARTDIEDGPDASDHRWGSAPDIARAYWQLAS